MARPAVFQLSKLLKWPEPNDLLVIPKGAKHSAKIYAGYADISFFNERGRYKRQ
jgi:hypothetical protein